MKNIFTYLFLCFTLVLSAQEAGRVGKLLENEVSENSQNLKLKQDKIKGENRGGVERNYQWNYHLGTSEVFVRIPERGNFTIEVNDQMIQNSTGMFRFFDLPTGYVYITISKNHFLLYKTRIYLDANTRTVLDYFTAYGLFVLDVYPIQNYYGDFNDWDDVWNNPYGNIPPYHPYKNVLSDREFNEFLKAYQKESFDSDKKEMLHTILLDTQFTAKQILTMVKLLNFDSEKLDLAKKLYHHCVDKKNYYLVVNSFEFNSSKKELREYIRGSR